MKLRVRGLRASPAPIAWTADHGGNGADVERLVYFGAEGGEAQTPVATRAGIGEAARAGPVIIEEYDSTTVVPPGWTVRRQENGFLVLEAAP